MLGYKAVRRDISNRMVEELLAKGMTCIAVAVRLGCSENIVYRVRDGKRKEPKPRKFSLRQRLCSCCGLNPVKRGNRFLCDGCYSDPGGIAYDVPDYRSVGIRT